MDKWSRVIYGINTQYDPEGYYDADYKELQRKLDKVRAQNTRQPNDQVEEQEGSSKKKKKGADNPLEGQITRGRIGIILPERNAFDFTERPEKQVEANKEKKKDQESGKAKLQKTLLQLKKSNMKSSSSKGMATVKIDH